MNLNRTHEPTSSSHGESLLLFSLRTIRNPELSFDDEYWPDPLLDDLVRQYKIDTQGLDCESSLITIQDYVAELRRKNRRLTTGSPVYTAPGGSVIKPHTWHSHLSANERIVAVNVQEVEILRQITRGM